MNCIVLNTIAELPSPAGNYRKNIQGQPKSDSVFLQTRQIKITGTLHI